MKEAPMEVIFLAPGAGRHYDAGPMHAVFKADGEETADRYCVSEWWLGPGDAGPGPHSHEDNVELFYVIEGTMRFLAGDRWLDAPAGSFLRVPAGVAHDFENRGTARAGVLNVFLPGGFERLMPEIVAYFAEQAGADQRRASIRDDPEGGPEGHARRAIPVLFYPPADMPYGVRE
jgi:mannose-6-phosphate isomerase-like protein (cupin superfamily)